jgi:hypothetical protein
MDKDLLMLEKSTGDASNDSLLGGLVTTTSRTALLADYLTAPELADELHVSKRTLDRWHAERRGPPRVTLQRQIFYRRAAVQRWLLDNERSFEDNAGRRRPRERSE